MAPLGYGLDHHMPANIDKYVYQKLLRDVSHIPESELSRKEINLGIRARSTAT